MNDQKCAGNPDAWFRDRHNEVSCILVLLCFWQILDNHSVWFSDHCSVSSQCFHAIIYCNSKISFLSGNGQLRAIHCINKALDCFSPVYLLISVYIGINLLNDSPVIEYHKIQNNPFVFFTFSPFRLPQITLYGQHSLSLFKLSFYLDYYEHIKQCRFLWSSSSS